MHPWGVAGSLLAAYCVLWLAALRLHTRGWRVPIGFLRSVGLPFICIRAGAIQSSVLLRRESRNLAELQKIEYAYHAVVGFAALWILTFQDGEERVVSPHRAGLSRALLDLERRLPGFSLENWRQEFAAGDVEDTLLLWEAKKTGPRPLENR
jgi:hypothetical protein